MFKQHTLITLLSLGALVGASTWAHAAPKPPTPFTLNLDGSPTEWRTHAEERPQPPLAKDPRFQSRTPPAGAEVLFDGKNLDAWVPAKKRKAPGQLWEIKNGVMVATGNDLLTKQSYGDAQLHIEWRIPKERKDHVGQGSTNSGVMFGDGRYEVQVLDVHPDTNKTYPDGMAGGIYAQFPPKFNAALPKGEWQSYDITFTAPRFDSNGNTTKRARFHVVWNNIVVQEDQELVGDCSWRGSKLFPTEKLRSEAKLRHKHPLLQAHPERLPLRLQFHGDPVEFRNIWIVDLEKGNEAKGVERKK
ncbi:MAG: DUF1080 domain-containing protein [Puniceicoccales bacterium]|jgi:hypothetical protein|nr:DUF1080 domain-containing protein [Puniceicoccales bacterium]